MYIPVFACQCDECGHVWLSEGYCAPSQCAKCKSHNWNSIGKRRRLDRILTEHAKFIAKHPKGTDFTNYKSFPELAAICHAAVHAGLKLGLLSKPTSCTKCKEPNRFYQIQAHHPDYSKPLEVEWLCCSCHRIGHMQKSKPPVLEMTYVRDEYSQD